jgi:hypothetical protein
LKNFALGLLILLGSQAWAVNKCAGPEGSAIFQDLPCDGKGDEITVKPASGKADLAAAKAARARVQAQRANEISENTARQEAGRSSKSSSGRQNCPSAHEIRNMETSANSITLSKSDKSERMRQIREAKACH